MSDDAIRVVVYCMDADMVRIYDAPDEQFARGLIHGLDTHASDAQLTFCTLDQDSMGVLEEWEADEEMLEAAREIRAALEGGGR